MIPKTDEKINRKRVAFRVIAYSLLLILFLSAPKFTIQAYTNLNWKILMWQLLALVIFASIAGFLRRRYPKVMTYSLLSIKNTEVPEFSLSFLFKNIALLIVLPQFVYMEEYIFRLGTDNWAEALLRSILFGFAHFLFGFDVAAFVTLIISGLYFSHFYFTGGILLAFQAHFLYDLIGIALQTLFVLLGVKAPQEDVTTTGG